MNIEDFKRIISTFADRPNSINYSKGELLADIRNDVISATLRESNGKLLVKEDDLELDARSWIKDRIALLPILADHIIDFVSEVSDFVDPCGTWDNQDSGQIQAVENCVQVLAHNLKSDIPQITHITYLTSDAGEGKTTIIRQLARLQAQRFKAKETDWLLVPISLGGRPFLRFDDITIASLVNTLHFRYFYYESFIELVKLGLIIPAFDGFEEMFMQNSSGEALTATGELINILNSQGSILIAARKAYFDYKSFDTQAKLYDSIHESVVFSKLAISRWGEDQFIQYATKRNIVNAKDLYDRIATNLHNNKHALLTRPVLAKKLLDVIGGTTHLNDLLSKLEYAADYFPIFIHSIIAREANEKWIDTSGDPCKPLISVEAHYDILSLLAEEMWHNSTNALQEPVIDFLADLYCEQNSYDVRLSRQVKERLKQHALIIKSNTTSRGYQFDHEEFYHFFLGFNIAQNILHNQKNDLKNILRKSILPETTISSIVSHIKKSSIKDYSPIIEMLKSATIGENKYSYIKENIGYITIKLLTNYEHDNIIELDEYVFPSDAFSNINIHRISFNDCYMQGTSLKGSLLKECKFNKCQIDRIELNCDENIENTYLDNCLVSMAYDLKRDRGYYDDNSIKSVLIDQGFQYIEKEKNTFINKITNDEDLILTEKILRRFIRSNTPINDTIFYMRLGKKGDYFIKNILKDLLCNEILEELPYTGAGQKHRYRLKAQFKDIEASLVNCKGVYQDFIHYFTKK